MRLILILTIVLGLFGFCGYRVYDHFHSRNEEARQKAAAAQAKMEDQRRQDAAALAGSVSAPPASGPAAPAVTGPPEPVYAALPEKVVAVGSYRFEHRLVPDAPGFLRDETKVGMIVQTDKQSNSWVWMGSPVLGAQIRDLATSYDVSQTEMDLDFVLVLVNAERLRANGLNVFYQDKASWLDALSLQGDAGSLRISANGFAVDLSLGESTTGVSLLSQPVIRCLDGQPWNFSTDSEIPVNRSEVIDGVIRQSVEFRRVGFGLDGSVRIVGDSILMSIEQRNGSVSTAAQPNNSEAPVFNVQSLKTTLSLGWLEWSVLGGIQVDKDEVRKGLFRNSFKASSDYLVIFCRPRPSLEAPPSAVPVNRVAPDSNPLLDGGVLPPREWLDAEIEMMESRVNLLQRKERTQK